MDDGQRPAVTVAVLGPFAVAVDGAEVHLPGRLRALLAGLAVAAGAPVPVERLVEVVWGEDLPVSPQRSLQVLVSRLRSVVGDDAVETVPGGYRLAVPAGQVDVASFAALVAAQVDPARPDDAAQADDAPPPGDPAPSDDAASPNDPTPSDPARPERQRLRDALALWRGAPFEGVGSVVLHAVDGPRLDEQRLTALARRIEIDLSALDDGAPDDRARDDGAPDGSPEATTDALVAELRELTDRYPLQERFWGQLLTALVAAGRRAEALDAYARLDRTLADELGIGPGEALRRQHRAILAGSDTRAGAATATSPATSPATGTANGPATSPTTGTANGPATTTATSGDTTDQPGWVPRQLPLGPLAFSGRADALAALDTLLADDAAPRVVVLDGAGGVGKTTTALHWAHRVAGRFPDGQLYANLRGFDPASAPVPAGQVVRAFLEALGVAKGRVPATEDARLALYRSVVAGRRLLVVLDNARDADQVAPLLPGPGAGPAVTVVTSRATLSGLTARDARRVPLGTLTPAEGAALLALRVGAGRAAAEPDAVRRIVERCAGLPLAVVIAAARVLARPAFPLSAVADELTDGGARLDALGDDDAMADVRSVFATSYRALTPDGARMFRLLGVHPGPDVSRDAAVALFDGPDDGAAPDHTGTALSELVRVSLVTEHSPGRYAMHDLVAEYAGERARQDEPRAAREAAVRRVTAWYLGVALEMDRRRWPARVRQEFVRDPGPVRVPEQEPTDWFRAERTVLLAVVEAARAQGLTGEVLSLVWALYSTLSHRAELRDALWTVLVAARDVAVEVGDRRAEVWCTRYLAALAADAGRAAECEALRRRTIGLAAELGDIKVLQMAHQGYAGDLVRWGRHADAVRQAEQALVQGRRTGEPYYEAHSLNILAWALAHDGDLGRALPLAEQALALLNDDDNPTTRAVVWDTLGFVHTALGDLERAIGCYQEAVVRFREFDMRQDLVAAERRMAALLGDVGRWAEARAAWQDCLDQHLELGLADVPAIRAELARAAALAKQH
ncbi:BTAD domain-containing putative transcriptional regulator [Promicromonospora sukumoe]|uniref:DNA-binding SARP family transcriptional activator/tetratricopeptide (TPR) repeat protein n=1 Tax=Promicromonospora sukumoe TaxID=88382 RepID=A0A7W3PDX3_9MICO|nr:BTAD domain-containing putative transcriptional regulator [Promicromonospora sukumoe]MBA8808273.1 DNA-binding SARP family transcriptional activator/tetratricopeptide (TPR) repeat protein [Promicromonospora sukumoe]